MIFRYRNEKCYNVKIKMDLELPSQNQSNFPYTNNPYTQNFMNQNITHAEKSLHDQIFGNQPQTKEDIFNDCEYDGGRVVYFGETTLQPSSIVSDKPYFRRLESIHEIPENVRARVREKIVTSNRRIHTVSDETLCTYVIQACQELGVSYDVDYVASLFNINFKKSNVFGFLSKATTRDNPTKDDPTSITVIIINPSSIIVKMFMDYVNKYSIIFDNLIDPGPKLYNFMVMIENSLPIVKNYSSQEIASATIYIYLKDKMGSTKKSLFSKKIFSSLAGITDKKFSTSCELIGGFIDRINAVNPNFLKIYY